MGVTREANKRDIAKMYRKLAKQYHPDMHREIADKIEAEINFKRVANA